MRKWIFISLILLLTGISQAQEQTPYEIALEHILEVERTGGCGNKRAHQRYAPTDYFHVLRRTRIQFWWVSLLRDSSS